MTFAANAALLASAAVEADEIRQYCNEMDELNELANEIGIADHQAERQKYAVSRSLTPKYSLKASQKSSYRAGRTSNHTSGPKSRLITTILIGVDTTLLSESVSI